MVKVELVVLIVCGIWLALLLAYVVYDIRTTASMSLPPWRQAFFKKNRGKPISPEDIARGKAGNWFWREFP